MSFNKVRNYWAKYVKKTYKAVRKYRREKKAGLRKWLANGIGNKLLWKFRKSKFSRSNLFAGAN